MSSMHILRKTVLILFLVIGRVSLANTPIKPHEPSQSELIEYLKLHNLSPETYIVTKFADHDYVFLGEYHRIKHDPELVQRLVPLLYTNGVYRLGIEFGCFENQAQVDSLINAPTYDEALARWLIFRWFCIWGYREYEDLYRAVWQFNRTLPPDAKEKFRIVNLNYRPNWPALNDSMTPDQENKIWSRGDVDAYMAEIIQQEFIQKGYKALIYSGSHHAFTKYRQPRYKRNEKKFIGYNDTRMGNLIAKACPGKTFTIFLHSPWMNLEGGNAADVQPVHGVVERVMKELGNPSRGFDVIGSPFGGLRATNTYYSAGYDDFCLSDFCDGYIFQKPLAEYEPCRVDSLFITDANVQEAIEYFPTYEGRMYRPNPAEQIESIGSDASLILRFKNVK